MLASKRRSLESTSINTVIRVRRLAERTGPNYTRLLNRNDKRFCLGRQGRQTVNIAFFTNFLAFEKGRQQPFLQCAIVNKNGRLPLGVHLKKQTKTEYSVHLARVGGGRSPASSILVQLKIIR